MDPSGWGPGGRRFQILSPRLTKYLQIGHIVHSNRWANQGRRTSTGRLTSVVRAEIGGVISPPRLVRTVVAVWVATPIGRLREARRRGPPSSKEPPELGSDVGLTFVTGDAAADAVSSGRARGASLRATAQRCRARRRS